MKYNLTSIILTDELKTIKKEIEESLGVNLTHQSVYRRGLESFKERLPIKIIKINVDEPISLE